jgi:formate hydrogenlyase transcriptional activator
MEKPTVMLVDDQPESLKPLIAYLKISGFRVLVAQNGEEALRRIARVTPDILLLDVLMPGLDGFETCRRLKEYEASRDIPVIFMTALSDLVEKVKGFEVGGVDYLTKPVQHEEVLARITTHLTIRRLQQQLQEQNIRFHTLADATFEGIFIHDDGRILDVNQTLEQMFDCRRDDVLGRQVVEFVSPKFHRIVLERIRAKDDTSYEAEGIKRDGTIFPVEVQTRLMPYQGRAVRLVAIRDLSWRKAMEAEHARLEQENLALRSTLQDRYRFGSLIGKSSAMQAVYEQIVQAAAVDANVVIWGESGTGKELVARSIHKLSVRQDQAFVAVNCGAIPEALFESEFFGHRKGAFTGAIMDKHGFFDQAHRGTLFLDEVSELRPAIQVKFLRVLQDGEYTPVGHTISKQADVRIIRRDEPGSARTTASGGDPGGLLLSPARHRHQSAAVTGSQRGYPVTDRAFPGSVRRRERASEAAGQSCRDAADV